MTQKPFMMFIDHEALQAAHNEAAEKVKEQGAFMRFPNGQVGRTPAYHTLKETTEHIVALVKEGAADVKPLPKKPAKKKGDDAPPADMG